MQEKTIAQALKDAGYVTAHFGKWHLNGYKGPGVPVLAGDLRNPGAFGFDEWVSATNFIDMAPWLGRNGVPEQLKGDSSELIVGEAVKFLEKHRAGGKPMFAIIWFGTPHSPFRASGADKAPFATLNDASANYHGKVLPPDPESINWFDAERYQKWLPQWQDHWAYKGYLNRAAAGPKKAGRKQKQ